jgi:type I restriction enzyme R subunit
MFEQAFKNIDDVLRKEAGCTTELDYTEQTSWLLFLKYLDGLEEDRATEAELDGKKRRKRPEAEIPKDTVEDEPLEQPRRRKGKVKLADGKARTIQHMMVTTFWHPDGAPMSAQQFLEMLFGRLPEFFKDEDELRALWSAPDTRFKLLQGLAEKGFGGDQLAEMQRVIDAEKSDLYDVLAHVAYASPPQTREERAARANIAITHHFDQKQQAFLSFVLAHYVNEGVRELDQDKLTPLLRLRYHNSVADAVADLGKPDQISKVFTGFQKHLYQP